MNRQRLRYLHYTVAPLMLFPLLLTALTGSLFQVAQLTGNSQQFYWLLDIHRGKFGVVNLEIIYPFINALGVIMLGITGILIWLQIRNFNE
ncbi:PepSY domain-containing protein [Aphanothece sacrum]|nr:PepSY domain-containing protein [Aphanothece sacrum]